MSAVNQNFAMHAGNDFTVRVNVYDSDGSAPDLTGASASWRLATTPGGAAVLTKTATISGTAPPVLQVALAAADTAALTPGQYFHEAKITDSGGKITTVTVGRCSIAPSLFAA